MLYDPLIPGRPSCPGSGGVLEPCVSSRSSGGRSRATQRHGAEGEAHDPLSAPPGPKKIELPDRVRKCLGLHRGLIHAARSVRTTGLWVGSAESGADGSKELPRVPVASASRRLSRTRERNQNPPGTLEFPLPKAKTERGSREKGLVPPGGPCAVLMLNIGWKRFFRESQRGQTMQDGGEVVN